jgi:hypothetical protein
VLQVVELQLPFTNHLLEAARRTYADKHPLAKDKEQAAKLRCDIGRSSDKGERLLDYSISCSNSLVSCPQALVLKAGAPGGSSSSSGAGGSRAASAASASKSAGSSPAAVAARAAFGSSSGGSQQQQGADGAGKENVLKLALKPVGVGIYPARLVLTSPCDVRVVELEVTAQSLGQSCVLELECPARQQVSMLQATSLGLHIDGVCTWQRNRACNSASPMHQTDSRPHASVFGMIFSCCACCAVLCVLQVLQDVPLVNSSDSALTATATLTGKGYSGPRELTVPAKGTGAYQLAFCPPGSGTFAGSLELFIAATGERNVYTLLGKGSEPLAERHIVVECQVRRWVELPFEWWPALVLCREHLLAVMT